MLASSELFSYLGAYSLLYGGVFVLFGEKIKKLIKKCNTFICCETDKAKR